MLVRKWHGDNRSLAKIINGSREMPMLYRIARLPMVSH